MKTTLLTCALAAAALAVHLPASAVDLDLYANPIIPPASSNVPNILFVIDNTANWSTIYPAEVKAIGDALHDLKPDLFKVGIMFGTETGNQNGNIGGGYLRAAVRLMDSGNKDLYEKLVRSFTDSADKGSGGLSGIQMAEAWQYYSGGKPYAGTDKNKADYKGNTYGSSAASKAVWALPGNAMSSRLALTYNSPVPANSCARNYIIYFSNGKNQANESDNPKSIDLLRKAATADGSMTADQAAATISLNGNSQEENPMDEWTRFMKKSKLGITTFAIEVNPGTQPADKDWTNLLKSAVGSNYKGVGDTSNGEEITNALRDVLSKIQSVNSVFAAVSLPASANVQGAYLNQLYIGMFRPDENSYPRWMGNLKQYKLGTENNLVDQDGEDALSTKTGFISVCARSFWTPERPTATTNIDTYWSQDSKGLCLPGGSNPLLYADANSPDGNIVEKGAQGYRLRGLAPDRRTVHTCSTTFADCKKLLPFVVPSAVSGAPAPVASATQLSASTDAERDVLIQFARGQNVRQELNKAATDMRPSVHGDVIHSNPLALSYGSNVIVYYGSNDGMLHAINGNRSDDYTVTSDSSTQTFKAGDELWSFIPPEFFPNIKRLYDNNVLVSVTAPVKTTPVADKTPPLPKPYGIDGPISTYREGDNTFIYAAMRRGGRAVYGFDVSAPASPKLLWKSGCAPLPSTDCSSALASETGQTWSTPRPTKIVNTDHPMVLIMGGGYDDCEDTDVASCTPANSKGDNITVLDPTDGAVLQVLPTLRGVVGEVRIVPDANGKALYGYAADLGGNLYRITIGSLAPGAWKITRIASLGCPTTASCASNRKFMFPPSVIPELDGSYSLYIGTGDREKPLNGDYFPENANITNYFFKVQDNPGEATWLTSENSTCGADLICLASLTSVGAVDGACGVAVAPTGKGWLLQLRPTEQVVTLAATRFGITTFSTHMPTGPNKGACTSDLGTVHVYNLDITTAKPAGSSSCADEVTGGGLPPPPEKLDVCKNDTCSEVTSICIGCGTVKGPLSTNPNGVPVTSLGSNAKRRVYWYIQK